MQSSSIMNHRVKLIRENTIRRYYDMVLSKSSNGFEDLVKCDLIGIQEMDIGLAKLNAAVGDCMLMEFDGRILPFQVVHKKPNGDCVMASYYVLGEHIFDHTTNVWRDCELRKHLNTVTIGKFSGDISDIIQNTEVHTENYTTDDRLWIPSHEEIGYVNDADDMTFVPNSGTYAFDYYRRGN